MTGLSRNASGVACLGGTPLLELLEQAQVRTPVYVYDLDAIAGETRALVSAFGRAPHVVAYAVKANTAGSIVRTIAECGGGADIVSGGELEVALRCGVAPHKIVMSGVAKQDWELDRAIGAEILGLQLESVEEIPRVAARAKALGKRANVSIRINPAVSIDSHAHIATGHDEAKFGVIMADLPVALERVAAYAAHLRLAGLSTHVGSMLATVEPYLSSARVIVDAALRLGPRLAELEFLDFGGGYGIDYEREPVAPPGDFARASLALLEQAGLSRLTLVVEPGRALVAPFGVLLARTLQSKSSSTRRFCLVDAGMNDLIRPALYQARHRIEPVERPPGGSEWQVVGPVCESADDFGLHALGDRVPEHVVIRDAGAYGFTMASEYNGRPLPAEVFVSGGRVVRVSASGGVAAWVDRRASA
ncbi:MAG: diaminopimelate decarboxylase [Polyangiaceae bacterium]|nr:diaminopimelate decarboxylase [Polyangiaceae bacterium]